MHAEHIGVSVNNGVVQLDGHTDSCYEKWAAERAVLRVAKVKLVQDEVLEPLQLVCPRRDRPGRSN